MRYRSTRGSAPELGFDDTLLAGLASDGGLYVPNAWPRIEPLPDVDSGYAAVAASVIRPFVGDGVVAGALDELCSDAYGSFRHPDVAPIRKVSDNRHLLELFWGPTLSFKDYALQLVGRMFDTVLEARSRRILVLGATSGDTGSAAIAALAGLPSVDVVILYPDDRVSEVQRRQMTTVSNDNVRAVAVAGTFDDCQDLVKAAFSTQEHRDGFNLAAVNSINWARVMCQAVYYVWTTGHVGPASVAVPTGNFGNVLAADVARRMGAPIRQIIAANNANHGIADIIDTGRLRLEGVIPTLAPAMDIQVASNFERYIYEMWDRDPTRVVSELMSMRETGSLVLDELTLSRMREHFSASWSNDGEIETTIARVHGETGLTIDPHTATGWVAADRHCRADLACVAVATAHPAKFPDAVAAATGVVPLLPEDLADLMVRPERTWRIDADLDDLIDLLTEVTT
ncbi:MAG: threonine synthase [Acidimicrobiia bacterium]|nr:threonine synthase [Acidimicrobiia bacterium]MDH4308019.1 threonine synthase [Acidimicrobiia bacterium]MDH5292292.1 threonine synthase [Acidimicrobiia bacterium]